MSNDNESLVRLFRLQAKINMLVSDGRRSAAVVADDLQKILEESVINPAYLRLISAGQTVTARATSGQRTFAGSASLFTGRLDPDFVRYGTNVPGLPTSETPTDVFELVQDGTYKDILGVNPADRLFYEQDQAVTFVEDHQDWIPKDGALMVPFRANGERFVACAYQGDGEFRADLNRFSCDGTWFAECHHRFAIPQP